MTFEGIEKLLGTKVFGITLLDPVMFCLKALAVFVLVQVAVWVIRNLMDPHRARQKNRKFDETSMVFFRKLLVTVVYVLGVACVLYMIPPLRTFATSILASAGIMAMAIGLASQEALSNFVSGIFIILAKPFRIGDIVALDSGQTGKVTEIAIRHTIITTAENRQIIVPNSKINSAIITNSTINDTRTCVFVEVGVAYSENLDHCIAEMRKVIELDPRVLDKRTEQEKADGVEKVIIRVMELGNSSITLRAYVWASNPAEAFVLKCDMLKAVKDHYDEVGIEIPYPYMNVVKKS